LKLLYDVSNPRKQCQNDNLLQISALLLTRQINMCDFNTWLYDKIKQRRRLFFVIQQKNINGSHETGPKISMVFTLRIQGGFQNHPAVFYFFFKIMDHAELLYQLGI
jgi:hypothetical protein